MFVLSVLAMLLAGCKETRPYGSIDSDFGYLIKERENNGYFSRQEFEWSLITPDKVPLYVLEAGHGEKVIALHGGFGMEHSYMRSFLKPFEKDYHKGNLISRVRANVLSTKAATEKMSPWIIWSMT